MSLLTNFSFIGKKSSVCVVTNFVGLLKSNIYNIQCNSIYNKLSCVNYNTDFNLRREYISLTNLNKICIKNERFYSRERKFENNYIFKNSFNNIIQRKIDEKKFLHSLTEKTDKFSKVEYKTPAYIKVNDNNKNNYSCNVNKSSAILNQDEIVVNIKNKKNELNQKTVIKNSPKKKLSFLKHLPNVLCIGRILGSPLIGYFIVKHKMKHAYILYAISGISDFLDGYLARKYNWSSKLGSVIDPLADKTLMIVTTVSLSISKLIPKYLAYTILSRDILLVLGTFVLVGKKFIDTRSTLSQFKNISVKVKPSYISKVNTALQILYLALTILSPKLLVLKYLQYVVFSTTIFSGMDYFINKNAVDISFNSIEQNDVNNDN